MHDVGVTHSATAATLQLASNARVDSNAELGDNVAEEADGGAAEVALRGLSEQLVTNPGDPLQLSDDRTQVQINCDTKRWLSLQLMT